MGVAAVGEAESMETTQNDVTPGEEPTSRRWRVIGMAAALVSLLTLSVGVVGMVITGGSVSNGGLYSTLFLVGVVCAGSLSMVSLYRHYNDE